MNSFFDDIFQLLQITTTGLQVCTALSPESECRHFHFFWSVLSGWGLQYTDITITSGFQLGHQLDWLWNQPKGKPVRTPVRGCLDQVTWREKNPIQLDWDYCGPNSNTSQHLYCEDSHCWTTRKYSVNQSKNLFIINSHSLSVLFLYLENPWLTLRQGLTKLPNVVLNSFYSLNRPWIGDPSK